MLLCILPASLAFPAIFEFPTLPTCVPLCRQERRQVEAARHERSGALALHAPPVNVAAGTSMASLGVLFAVVKRSAFHALRALFRFCLWYCAAPPPP